jgi:hypothetical protein
MGKAGGTGVEAVAPVRKSGMGLAAVKQYN